MVDVVSLLTEYANSSLQNLFVDTHGSLGGQVANVGSTSHLCFKSYSVGVVNWIYTIPESCFCKNLFSSNLRQFSPVKETYMVCRRPLGKRDSKGFTQTLFGSVMACPFSAMCALNYT